MGDRTPCPTAQTPAIRGSELKRDYLDYAVHDIYECRYAADMTYIRAIVVWHVALYEHNIDTATYMTDTSSYNRDKLSGLIIAYYRYGIICYRYVIVQYTLLYMGDTIRILQIHLRILQIHLRIQH